MKDKAIGCEYIFSQVYQIAYRTRTRYTFGMQINLLSGDKIEELEGLARG